MDLNEEAFKEKIEALLSEDVITRMMAKNDLVSVGPRIVPPLLKVIEEDPRDMLRYWVIDVLGALKEQAKEAVPLLSRLLIEDDFDRVRSVSAGVLNVIVENIEEIIPVLIKAYKKDKSEEVQRTLNMVLIQAAKKLGYPSIEALIEAFGS
jgi:HEAT repeat protein